MTSPVDGMAEAVEAARRIVKASDAVRAAHLGPDRRAAVKRLNQATDDQYGVVLAARALLSLVEKQGEWRVAEIWQDIKTAPEAQDVLVYIPTAKGRTVRTGRYNMTADGKPLWTYGGEFAFDVGKATHWKALPLPPKARA